MPRWTQRTALDPNHKPQCVGLPSSTVTKSWGASPQERHVVSTDGTQIRRLTVHEIAKIQGFPADWFDVEGVSERNRIGLAGNAVPPPVARAMFSAMRPLTGPRLGEFFAGAGGLALGARAAGYRIETLVDLWEPSCRLLEARFGSVQCMSIDDIDFAALRGRIDVFSGGPPCQPFTSGGKRLGPEDPRDRCTALPLVLRQLRPEAFFFEEARELFFHDGGRYWEHLKQAFHRAGYRIAALLVNAHDFGVPQTRYRAMVAGFQQASPSAWARAVLSQARPGESGIVADVLEAWEPWGYGCRRGGSRTGATTRAVYVD